VLVQNKKHLVEAAKAKGSGCTTVGTSGLQLLASVTAVFKICSRLVNIPVLLVSP
jgi:hypothetical protein